MRTARLSVTPIVFAAAVIAVSACGEANEAQDAIDPVAQAAQVTQRSGTAAVVFHGQVVTKARTVPLEGRGVIDTGDESRARLTFRFDDQGKTVKMDEILAGKTLYIGGEAFRGHLPSGKKWAKLDIDKVAAKAGLDARSFDGGGGSSASEMLRYLRGAGSVRKQGSEKVAGASTTHYHAVVDVAKLAEQRGDHDFAASMRKLRMQVKGPMTLDVWIDGARRVRQEKLDYAAVQQGESARFAFTMQFTRFGVPLNVDPPPKEDVRDITDDVLREVDRRSP